MSRRKRKPSPAGQGQPSAGGPDPTSAPARRPTGLRAWLLAVTVLLFVARPLVPSESIGMTGDGTPLVMLVMLLLAAWSVAAIRRREAVRFGLTDAAVLAFLAIYTVAACHGTKTGNLREGLNVLWAWVGLGAGYFLLRQLIRHAREARAIVAVMIALGVALSVYGLYQYFYELPQQRLDYARNPEQVMREAGFLDEPGSMLREQFKNRVNSREPFATFALANSLAGYLAPWLVVAIGILGSVARREGEAPAEPGSSGQRPARQEPRPPRGAIGWRLRDALGASLVLLPVAACLLLTKSRSALVATALGVVLLAIAGPARRIGRRVWVVAALAIAGLVASVWAVGGLDKEVLSEAGKSFSYRLEYWQSTMAMIRDHPWLGCGPGQFQNAYGLYRLPQASETVADPHNAFLEIWATAGSLAAVAFVAILGCFCWALWRRRQQQRAAESPFETPPTDDASRWVYGGALVGFLAGWPLGALGTTAPSLALLGLGLPAAVAMILLLADWVQGGRLPAGVVLTGLVVLLVNLLAAGGIGFPGVAGSFWLLLAVGLFAPDGRDARRSRPVAAWSLVGLAVALAVACYLTSYRPVMAARGHVLAASDEANVKNQLLAATKSDPAWVEPWRLLAAMALDQWRRTGAAPALDDFERYSARAVDCDSRSGSLRAAVGKQYFEVYKRTGKAEHVQAAVAAQRRAVVLCPANAEYHADLAVALDAAGDQAAARRSAEAALHLDDQMPHRDKKLPPEVRQRLLLMAR